MVNKQLIQYRETITVYCNAHKKRKFYGQIFFFCFKLTGICSNKWILNAKYIIYVYFYCIKTTWTMRLIILTVYVSLEAARFFETSG